jgi:hypothetical protein
VFKCLGAHGQQNQRDPKLTEIWSPVPKIIKPGKTPTIPSSDAIILFEDQIAAREGETAGFFL